MEAVSLNEEQHKLMDKIQIHASEISNFITSYNDNPSGYQAIVKLKEVLFWVQDMLIVESMNKTLKNSEIKATHETVAQVQ